MLLLLFYLFYILVLNFASSVRFHNIVLHVSSGNLVVAYWGIGAHSDYDMLS